eukprot:1473660-Amphidinium_carterae.1
MQKTQFNEWAGEVKIYLTIDNVNFEDYMDSCARSIETVNIVDLQDGYTADDVTRPNTRFPAAPAERTTSHKWLEDINRYESENGQGSNSWSITDHVKIATIINHLRGPIAQHMMLKVNNTNTIQKHLVGYSGNGTIGRVNNEDEEHNEYYMIAFNKWMKGKGKKGDWNKGTGKGKDKGGKKGYNHNNYNCKGAKRTKDTHLHNAIKTHKEKGTEDTHNKTTARVNSNRATNLNNISTMVEKAKELENQSQQLQQSPGSRQERRSTTTGLQYQRQRCLQCPVLGTMATIPCRRHHTTASTVTTTWHNLHHNSKNFGPLSLTLEQFQLAQ